MTAETILLRRLWTYLLLLLASAVLVGGALAASLAMRRPSTKAPTKPRPMEHTRPMPTFCQPDHCNAARPPPAKPAPARPASRACDLLTGMPRRAARLPQMMIETMVAVIDGTVSADGATMPLPTVAATAVPAAAPSVFMITAMTIACRGVITPVEMTVAIAFGASVHPLTNSAASTIASAITSPIVSALIHASLRASDRTILAQWLASSVICSSRWKS